LLDTYRGECSKRQADALYNPPLTTTQIVFDRRLDGWDATCPTCAVDTTLIRIMKPEVNDFHFYSAKHGYHGVKYELAVLLVPPHHIVWCGPGYRGSVHDMAIASFGFIPALLPHERVLADLGYHGEHFLIPLGKRHAALGTPEGKEYNYYQMAVRCCVERVNALVKTWNAAGAIWRGSIHSLEQAIQAIVVLVELRNQWNEQDQQSQQQQE